MPVCFCDFISPQLTLDLHGHPVAGIQGLACDLGFLVDTQLSGVQLHAIGEFLGGVAVDAHLLSGSKC